jgi:hypothetical protein
MEILNQLFNSPGGWAATLMAFTPGVITLTHEVQKVWFTHNLENNRPPNTRLHTIEFFN